MMAGDTIVFHTVPEWAQIKFCVHHTGTFDVDLRQAVQADLFAGITA
jgi:hypothetical protein